MRTISLPLLLSLVALGVLARTAEADPLDVTFAVDGSGSQSLDGSSLSVTLSSLELGTTTFDAILQVIGSNTLHQSTSGLGVVGGSNPINDGESLSFSLVLQNESGGGVIQAAFAGVDLTFFGATGEQAVFSLDESLATTSDNFLTAEGSAADPVGFSPLAPDFTLFGNANNGGTVSFRVDSVDASFTLASDGATPAPEPGTLLLVGLGAALVGRRCRRVRGRAGRRLSGSAARLL